MARKAGHLLTRNIGNLRGFSTASDFVRPPNVATAAVNQIRYPDDTLAVRRGYQCQIGAIGGLGTGTYHDADSDNIETVTINFDGNLYKKNKHNIYFYYNGISGGTISAITQANPAQVTSANHGLINGAQVSIKGVNGMVNINGGPYTVNVVDANNFTLVGVDSTAYPAYVSGGFWSYTFTNYRYLNFTIFTDSRYLTTNPGWNVAPWSTTPWGAPRGQSITCQCTENFAAQANGNQANVNTFIVRAGHDIRIGHTITFIDPTGTLQQRNVTGVTATSVTFSGLAASINNNASIGLFFDIRFLNGYDSPIVTIQNFIDFLRGVGGNPLGLGIAGLGISANYDTNLPAAFIQILEPIIIDVQQNFQLSYYTWDQTNQTIPVAFPGSADPEYQNAADFENASMAAYDDVIYIANGIDFPKKYDGQTLYLAGLQRSPRPFVTDAGAGNIPNGTYNYGVTFTQVDNVGHVAESQISEFRPYTVTGGPKNNTVTVPSIPANSGYNTNCAIAVGGTGTVYGPDNNGYYYSTIPVNPGYSLKVFDTAYYTNTIAAVKNGASATPENTFTVNAGSAVVPGDVVVFADSTGAINTRTVTQVLPTSITVGGAPVSVNNGTNFAANLTSTVYANIAIANGNQNNVNTVVVAAGHSLQVNDVIYFNDIDGNLQRRNVTAIAATTVTFDSIPISIGTGTLIYATVVNANAIRLQHRQSIAPTLGANAPISNNLRINIWRTPVGTTNLQLLAVLPNNSFGISQNYTDQITDANLQEAFPNPSQIPNPPPISKYVRTFGDQLIYAGGERNNPENDDAVYFSSGGLPESVPALTNVFFTPSTDDAITGIGVAGTTLAITKNRSLYVVSGDLLTSQFQIEPIAFGSNIGCVAHATIVSVGSMMYFLDTSGVYALVENQLYPTDAMGKPIAMSEPIDLIFRQENFFPNTRYVTKRAVACNYNKDQQYLLFLPCEDARSSVRSANVYSILLCFDYQSKNWFKWNNINAAGGIFTVGDDLYFQERRTGGVTSPSANLYKQHRFYRLVDHADHTSAQQSEWLSSWEDLGYPEVRKKFVRCMLLINTITDLRQYNNPQLYFTSYLNRIANLPHTQAQVATVDENNNAGWSNSAWGWNNWSGYTDNFVSINLRAGTVAKSMQVGFTLTGINVDYRFAGYQLEAVPENRATFVR